MTSGTDRITAERARQIEEEGYTPDRDKGRTEELITAAVSYLAYNSALHEYGIALTIDEVPWPWDPKYFKPTGNEKRDLTKAGALIAAAIDSVEDKQ